MTKQTLIVAALVALTTLPACQCNMRETFMGTDDQPVGEPDVPQRITFESSEAPYTVELPAGWQPKAAADLNRHADLAATEDDRLFLIVIPQKLPDVDAVDVESLKEASLARMRTNVEQLKIERQGPVTLPDGTGLSVFAEGVADGHPVQYVAAFITHGRWGYQIVAWGPAEAEDTLIQDVDRLVGGWQFASDSLDSPPLDSGPSDSSEQETD